MDIEGGEAQFFKSDEFKRWIVDNGIVWLVELHPQTRDLEWSDVPHRRIGNGYVAVYHPDATRVAEISPAAVPVPA
jgi:hypothetical protein